MSNLISITIGLIGGAIIAFSNKPPEILFPCLLATMFCSIASYTLLEEKKKGK